VDLPASPSAAPATPVSVAAPPKRGLHQPAVRRALAIVLAVNVAVVLAKTGVGWKTGALTVLGSALESGLDLLNIIIGMTLVTVAARAPDEDHPYGHEKFESLGTLVIVGFLSISCFELLREAVEQLLHRATPHEPTIADFVVMVATIAVNAFVAWYERSRGRALGSAFLIADATHAGSDLYVTSLALVSLIVTRAGRGGLDAPLAILVAVLIARNGYIILKGSVPVLVDQRAVDAARIRELVTQVPRVTDVRLVRSRATSSGLLFAEVTIGISASTSVAEAHAISDAVEAQIITGLGAAEVTVHVEPA
jgi:cation diffusion facilitator family transporter